MSDKPDWEAIQGEYESSDIPYPELAVKYGVPPGTLYSRSRKWNQDSRSRSRKILSRIENQESGIRIASLHVLRPAPSPINAVAGANLGLEALVEILQENAKSKQMDLADHVKAANALAQYNKIIINAMPEDEKEEGETELVTIDTRDLSSDRLAKLKAFALEMKEEEQVG